MIHDVFTTHQLPCTSLIPQFFCCKVATNQPTWNGYQQQNDKLYATQISSKGWLFFHTKGIRMIVRNLYLQLLHGTYIVVCTQVNNIITKGNWGTLGRNVGTVNKKPQAIYVIANFTACTIALTACVMAVVAAYAVVACMIIVAAA